MSVNLSELRKFQDIWGPVLQTIPAVIEMVERKDDLDRSIAAAQREYDKVKTHIEDQLKIGTAQIDAAVVRLHEAEAKRAEVLKDIEAAKAKAREDASAAEQAKQERLAVVNAKIVEASNKLSVVEKDYSAKLAQERAAHAEATAAMQAEIAALEARKNDVQAALDSLKAKLG